MTKKILTVGLIILFALYWRKSKEAISYQCNYIYTEQNEYFCKQIEKREFKAPEEAKNILTEILEAMGMRKANFVLVQCDSINNCLATIDGSKRYIIYDNEFMNSINNISNTKWSSTSILAHEIGHHLNGHFLKSTEKDYRQRQEEELDADFTSGFAMAKLGATLEESKSAMMTLEDDDCNEDSLRTHPCRNKRLKSIEEGWRKGQESNSGPNEVNSGASIKKIFPGAIPHIPGITDHGISNLPKFYGDIDNDGLMDFGRFVGNDPDIFLSFQLGKKTGFSGNSYVYNSYKRIDKGILTRPIWLEDVNGDGKLDYCRYVGNFPGIFRAALLGTATGFDGEHYFKF